MEVQNKPLVSVIVPTKNSIKTIKICLQSVRKQSYSNIEIIVVDNYSWDGTSKIAREYGRVFLKGPERSAQRNFGAAKAKEDYFFFIDSDMELTPKVIEECVKEALDKNIDAIIVPEISAGEGFWARCKILERSCYIKDSLIEAARFFEKEIFFKVKGYDENLVAAEDWDLSQRVQKAGYKIGRISSHIIHHEGHLTLWDNIKRKFYYAQTIDCYKKKHPDLFAKQATIFRPAFFRHWKRLIRDPLHTMGFFFMKTCEFSAGALGFLLMKMSQASCLFSHFVRK